MDLQDATIIYLALILPILLILSFSLSVSIKEMRVTNDYQNKLIDATRDGIKAFEINTSNEDFRDVTDALKVMVEASINTFKTGFAKRVGMDGASKATIDNYLPFTLFTLNDGYYINSPSFTPHVIKFKRDGVAAHVGDYGVAEGEGDFKNFTLDNDKYEKAKYPEESNQGQNVTAKPKLIESLYNPVLYQKYEEGNLEAKRKDIKTTIDPTDPGIIYDRTNVLKNYIPYSARYVNDSTDVVISYSMDNFISVVGKKKNGRDEEYFSRSGYLLDPNIDVKVDGIKSLNMDSNVSVADDVIDKIIDHSKNEITLTISNIKRWYTNPENGEEKTEILDPVVIKYKNPSGINFDPIKTEFSYILQQREAIKYYIKAYYFTKWTFNKLDDIKVGDFKIDIPDKLEKALRKTDRNGLLSIINLNNAVKEEKIFDKNQDDGYLISNKDSNYNYHKKTVMRNSIQYNLFIAASNFSKIISQTKTDKPKYKNVEIPMISDMDWESLCSNISMVTFANGFKTPKGILSTYAIVSSGDNQFTINEDGLYFVAANTFDRGIKANKEEDYINNPLYKYHKITSPELEKLDRDDNIKGYVGDLINNYIYDGRVLTEAERRAVAGDDPMKASVKEYMRKNYKSFRSVVEDTSNLKKDEDVKMTRKTKRTNALYSTIGAKKNARVNLIAIKNNRTFKIFRNINSINEFQGKLNSSKEKYMPAIKDIQIVVRLPKIDEVKHTLLGTVVNPYVIYDLNIQIGNFTYLEENLRLSAKARNTANNKNDLEYATINMINYYKALPRESRQKITKFIDIGNEETFGTGEDFKIEFENIKTNLEDESIRPDLEIVEVRINYN